MIEVVASDGAGMSNPVYIPVTVEQTLTSMSIQAASPTVNNGNTDVVTGIGTDQFGNPMPLKWNRVVELSHGVGGLSRWAIPLSDKLHTPRPRLRTARTL